MSFRWIALLALWTLLSGPIFGTAPIHNGSVEGGAEPRARGPGFPPSSSPLAER